MPQHFISLQTAREMTTNYRKSKENLLKPDLQNKGILPICETFDRTAFDTILSDANCKKVRVYLCVDSANQIRVLVVAVNGNDEDILPSGAQVTTDDEGRIIEEGQRCPDICPPPSPLTGP
jgi:hypothetical protein